MEYWILYAIGCVIAGIAGSFYRKSLIKDAEEASKETLIATSNDSTKQAYYIGTAISRRACLLGNSNLMWLFHDDYNKKTLNFYALDSVIDDNGKHTQAFLKGKSTILIKFIRECHACGCSVMLRQIGAKVDVLQYPEQEYFLSKPDLELFKKKFKY